MKKVEFTFRSSDQKTPIHAIKWEPDQPPHAILQIAHGMAEYIDRYDSFAQILCACGILVVGNDHLGHGESVVSSSDWGYFAEQDGEGCVLRDIHRLKKLTQTSYPQTPYFLLGHSMGSFFVRRYLCKYSQDALSGAILSGTGHYAPARTVSGMLLTRLIQLFRGWHYRSPLMDRLITGNMNKSFQPERTPKDWLTRDESVVDAYIEDERCGFVYTLNGYYNLLRAAEQMERLELLRHMNRDTPVLLISGEDDPVGDFGKGVKQIAVEFRKVGMKQVDCILYPHMRHEILNELGKENVYKDIVQFVAVKIRDHL